MSNMTKFEKLKAASKKKFVEFTHEGETYWVCDPQAMPAALQAKIKEYGFTATPDVAEAKAQMSENSDGSIQFMKWGYMAALHEKNEQTGAFERVFDDKEIDEAYECVTNDFIAALDKVIKSLRPEKETGADTKNE